MDAKSERLVEAIKVGIYKQLYAENMLTEAQLGKLLAENKKGRCCCE